MGKTEEEDFIFGMQVKTKSLLGFTKSFEPYVMGHWNSVLNIDIELTLILGHIFFWF